MQTILSLASVIGAIALLWTGIKRLEVSSYWKTVISTLDLLVLGGSVVLLGWIGAVAVVVANVLAVIIVSVRMAMQKEEMLIYASTQCGATKEELEAVYDELGATAEVSSPFTLMGPLERASMLSRLAQRARSVDEMRLMAPPIGLLWVVHRPDLNWLVDRFDQLLRLYAMDASDAMHVADVVTASTKVSAATFEEMVDAMVKVAEP